MTLDTTHPTRPSDAAPKRPMNRWRVWIFVSVELVLVSTALAMLAAPPLRLQVDGLRMTGPIIEVVSHRGDSTSSVTVRDATSEGTYTARMGEGRRIGDVASVVVDPNNGSEVWTPAATYVGALSVVIVCLIAMVWPIGVWIQRRYSIDEPGTAASERDDRLSGFALALALLALDSIVVLLFAPAPFAGGQPEVDAFFGDVRWSVLPVLAGAAALAVNRRGLRTDWRSVVATFVALAFGLTLAGVILWAAERA